MQASGLVDRLDEKNQALMAELEGSKYCRHFFAPQSSTALIEALMASLLHEVASYGGHLVVAVSTALGRLANDPRWLPWVRPLMESLLSEVTHPEMARQDSRTLNPRIGDAGGSSEQPSPAAFAVAAIARFLCEQRHPLSHLGFFYLLEGTTSLLAPRMQEVLEERGVNCRFVQLHAKEDVAHTAALRETIIKIVEEDPRIVGEIEYGFDCFAAAYPLSVWNAAADRALAAQP